MIFLIAILHQVVQLKYDPLFFPIELRRCLHHGLQKISFWQSGSDEVFSYWTKNQIGHLQICTIKFESFSYSTDQMQLQWRERSASQVARGVRYIDNPYRLYRYIYRHFLKISISTILMLTSISMSIRPYRYQNSFWEFNRGGAT